MALRKTKTMLFLIIMIIWCAVVMAQPGGIKWSSEGTSYFKIESNELNRYQLPANTPTTIISKSDLTPPGTTTPLAIRAFFLSQDGLKVMVYTNSKKVWRIDSRGDYWVLDLKTKTLKNLGAGRPESSLMFAKFSPDGNKVGSFWYKVRSCWRASSIKSTSPSLLKNGILRATF